MLIFRLSPMNGRSAISCGVSFGLRPNFTALRLGVGAASRRAVDDPASFKLGRNAEDRKNELLKIRGRINQRLGKRAKDSARFFKVAGDNE